MADSWKEWRRKLSEDHPEVKPEYTNRLGIWHHDFYRERLTKDCGGSNSATQMWMGREYKRPSTDYDGPTVYDGGFTKSGLIQRGWTRTAIKRILGEPDWHLFNGFGKDRQACMYSRARVEAAEQQGKIRYRRAPEQKDPFERFYWQVGRRNGQELPPPEVGPSAWLSSLTQWDFNWIGICHPWHVERLVFHAEVGMLDIYVAHACRITWPCPKCGRRCRLYDHRPNRPWLEGWMPIWASDPMVKDRAVPATVGGRLPRCYCPKHGAREVQPLLPFHEAEGKVIENEGIEWVIVPSL
jgi:hypothetical protein